MDSLRFEIAQESQLCTLHPRSLIHTGTLMQSMDFFGQLNQQLNNWSMIIYDTMLWRSIIFSRLRGWTDGQFSVESVKRMLHSLLVKDADSTSGPGSVGAGNSLILLLLLLTFLSAFQDTQSVSQYCLVMMPWHRHQNSLLNGTSTQIYTEHRNIEKRKKSMWFFYIYSSQCSFKIIYHLGLISLLSTSGLLNIM